jgi:ABC-type antimicrobial peptide transport system permease subunit
VSLVVACIGVYGVLAFSVTRRRREFGIRLALGATARQVILSVARDGARLVLVGLLAGLVLALAVGSRVEGLLFDVTPRDPLVFVAAGGLLLAAALVACWLPARRVTSVNPLEVLQAE